jgi:predicted metalloprotease
LLQFKERYENDWGLRHELIADYLAGWYLTRTQGEQKDIALSASQFFSNLGDTDFANIDHHGTPRQRSSMLLQGGNMFEFGNRVPGNTPVDPQLALKRAIAHVSH